MHNYKKERFVQGLPSGTVEAFFIISCSLQTQAKLNFHYYSQILRVGICII